MIYPFYPYLYKNESKVVQELLDSLNWSDEDSQITSKDAIKLIEQTRKSQNAGGQLETFLQEFSLNTDEGLAMMCLAEALLRIPDVKTANALIKDKVAAAKWLNKQGSGSKDWMAKVAGISMSLSRKTLNSALSKIGEPIIREAMVRAMQMMGKNFVLGTSIENAISNAKIFERQGYRMSYDMLGEGARDLDSAEKYFKAYAHAIDAISPKNEQDPARKAGISVKLSALHPRYTYSQKERCIPEIVEKLTSLALKAASHNMPLTIDAEEVGRLDISIEIIKQILQIKELEGWDGFGLAVQAYQKKSLPLVKYLAKIARKTNRKIQIRLVKGAYWDSEIKHAQIGGFAEYPVFTRKSNTDLSYLACAQELFKHLDVIYPMFATHNAHSIAAIRHMASKSDGGYEFQRLHGMGEGLYANLVANGGVKVSIYAPVGAHKDLLPYLVRRLLENGANSSFVNQLLDEDIPAKDIIRDPVAILKTRTAENHRHPAIPLPKDIFENRVNSKGIDFNDPISSQKLLDYIANYKSEMPHPLDYKGSIDDAFDLAKQGFCDWSAKDVQERSSIIERFSYLLEENSHELVAILVHEAGKTIPDAYDELREAVDFCRYYAQRARDDFNASGVEMQGYTGETNRLTLQGRGVFVCISPWNFPLAIFTGQIIAALAAGNAVIAKPASQTKYIAVRVVELMQKAGIPHNVLHLLLGNGAFGSEIVANSAVSGVVFTGSTATAKHIQKTLVVHNDAIVPLIAETGGQNAMIVDSSALTEQVVDDVIISAFGSAGQRCSALRVLYLQDDVADDIIFTLKGAMSELNIGAPDCISTDIGYVIDSSLKSSLDSHVEYLEQKGIFIAKASAANNDRLFAPIAYEIPHIDILTEEVFGAVLHIIRYNANDLDKVIKQINNTGYGLTFGIHSRINSVQDYISSNIHVGNIYINRSMTGAIVGVQPFGGMGMSGTGPKAGGPHYLRAFAVEKIITTDTTASGGNASLISLSDT